MKKYIKKSLFFISPIFIIILLSEIILVPLKNTFNSKAKYIQNNNGIECLFLGSSHTQNDINPGYLSIKSANLAYGGQDYKLDSALFFRYIDDLQDIKYVVLEVDYHSLEQNNTENYFRLPWYYYYHNIKSPNSIFLDKYLLFQSSPTFFSSYILRKITPDEYKYKINEYGFVVNDFPGSFEDSNYNDSLLLVTSRNRLIDRHKDSSIQNYEYNKKILLAIIDYCTKKDIEVILLKNPLYITYRNNYIFEKLMRRNSFIDSININSSIHLFDFEKDTRFDVTDFKNDDHLNSNGARKLTKIINKKIICLRNNG